VTDGETTRVCVPPGVTSDIAVQPRVTPGDVREKISTFMRMADIDARAAVLDLEVLP
jgi:hypothetical protein